MSLKLLGILIGTFIYSFLLLALSVDLLKQGPWDKYDTRFLYDMSLLLIPIPVILGLIGSLFDRIVFKRKSHWAFYPLSLMILLFVVLRALWFFAHVGSGLWAVN